jgi:glycosyltransferase domain-containing protein
VHLGPDTSVTKYLEKIVHVLGEVKTDYVMFMANDDFVFYDSIFDLEKFLNTNTEYVSVLGMVFDISLNDYHHFNSAFFRNIQNHQVQMSLEADSPGQRAKVQISHPSAGWHSLVRTSVVLQVYKIILQSEVRNFELTGYFADLLLGCYGKVKYETQFVSMLHEIHGDQEAYNLIPYETRIQDQKWLKEVQELFDVVSQQVESNSDSEFSSRDLLREYFKWEESRMPKNNPSPVVVFFRKCYEKIKFEIEKLFPRYVNLPTNFPLESIEGIRQLELFLSSYYSEVLNLNENPMPPPGYQ